MKLKSLFLWIILLIFSGCGRTIYKNIDKEDILKYKDQTIKAVTLLNGDFYIFDENGGKIGSLIYENKYDTLLCGIDALGRKLNIDVKDIWQIRVKEKDNLSLVYWCIVGLIPVLIILLEGIWIYWID
jgi:hypothetical protein